MTDKSYVSTEQHVCLVCGLPFDTGCLFLDKRLRPSLERHTTTGWGLCSEHQRLSDEGFIALVECDPARSHLSTSDRMKPESAYRTGRIAHLKRTVWGHVFNVEITGKEPCVFVEPGVIDQLEAMMSAPGRAPNDPI